MTRSMPTPPKGRRLVRGLIAGLILLAPTGFLWVSSPLLLPPSGESLARLAPEPHRTIQARGPQASVLLVGDMYFGESYFQSAPAPFAARGYGYPLLRLRQLAASADTIIANLEAPLTTRSSSPVRWMKTYVHRGDPQPTANALSDLGVHAVNLANNHTSDFLARGIDDTLGALSSRGIAAFGAGHTIQEAARPYRFDIAFPSHALRVAVIGAFETRWEDLAYGAYAADWRSGCYALLSRTITRQIEALKQADPQLFVVVFPHWGADYTWRSTAQADMAHAIIDAGADIVVGHGAHMFQEIEPYAGRLIVYNLGNFAFLSPGRYSTPGAHPFSMAARLEIGERDSEFYHALRLYFVLSDNRVTDYQPRLLEGEDFEHAANLLAERQSLTPEARARLGAATTTGRDELGQYLLVDLGALGPATARNAH